MVLAGHTFSVAVASTERTGAPGGGIGWWVLALAIGLGTVAVLLIVGLLDRLTRASAERRQATVDAASSRPGQVVQLQPLATLVGASVAAHSLETSVTSTQPPRRAGVAAGRGARRTPPRPRRPIPHLSLPALPQIPRPRMARPRVPRPQVAVGPVLRQRLATAPVRRPPRRRGTRVGADWLHVVAAAAVPAALGLRTLLDPGWWRAPETATVVQIAVAVVLAATGLHWLRQTTQRPYALRRITRERLRSAETFRLARVDAARRLLAVLDDDGGPPAAWAEFSREAGLHVPPRMRSLVSRQMDPEALVRYLGTQALEATPTERQRWVAVTVPLVSCLLPAALMIVVG